MVGRYKLYRSIRRAWLDLLSYPEFELSVGDA